MGGERVTFLDSLLHVTALRTFNRNMSVPVRMEEVNIRPKELADFLTAQEDAKNNKVLSRLIQ